MSHTMRKNWWVIVGLSLVCSLQSNATPMSLAAAAKKGDLEGVKSQLRLGVSPNEKDGEGQVPLFYAAQRGFEEIVKLLLESGAAIDRLADQKRKCDLKKTSLMTASSNGHLGVVRLLLKHGANPKESFDDFSCGDSLGDPTHSPIGMAALAGHVGVFNDLLSKLDAGNDPHLALQVLIKNVTDERALIAAPEIAKYITQTFKTNESLLHAAAYFGKRETLKFLISKKYNINTHANLQLDYGKADFFGETPLMLAARSKHKDISSDLITAGADVNAEDDLGRTALLEAIKNTDLDTINLLLNKKANVNAQMKMSCNEKPLIKTTEAYAEYLDESMVQRPKKGCTPLMLAATRGDQKSVSLLIKHGANKHTQDFNGKSAFTYAQEAGHAELLAILRI